MMLHDVHDKGNDGNERDNNTAIINYTNKTTEGFCCCCAVSVAVATVVSFAVPVIITHCWMVRFPNTFPPFFSVPFFLSSLCYFYCVPFSLSLPLFFSLASSFRHQTFFFLISLFIRNRKHLLEYNDK